MAKCSACGQEMTDHVGCTLKRYAGETKDRVPFDAGRRMTEEEWMEGWRKHAADRAFFCPDLPPDTEEDARRRMAEYFTRWSLCPDCGCPNGSYTTPAATPSGARSATDR